MANPLGGLFAPGFCQQMGQGFQNNSNMLSTLGAGLLAHRQNANNPMFGDPRMLMLAQQADQERQEAERQRQESLAKDTATREFAINELGFDLPTVDALAASGQLGPVVMDEVAKRRAPPPAPEWKVVGKQLVRIDPNDPEPDWYSPPGGAAADPAEAFDIEQKLRKEYSGHQEVEAFTQIKRGYETVRAAASEASGPGDVGVVIGYMKILDPGSVVHPGEAANIQNASGVPEQIRNLYNRLLEGDRLTPTQRQEIVQAADSLYQQQMAAMKSVNENYTGIAGEYGINPSRVVRPIPAYEPLKLPTGGTLTPRGNGEMDWTP